MAYFHITPGVPSLSLPPSRKGEVSFAVTNNLGRPVRVQASARPDDEGEAAWLSIVGEVERDLAPNETETFLVQIQVPANVAAGDHRLRLLVAAVDHPDDEYNTSPDVAFTVPVAAPVVTPFPWWIVATAAAVLIVAGSGILLYRAIWHPGLGDPCDPAGKSCRGDLSCSQRDGGPAVCLEPVGTECTAAKDCVTGLCEGRDGGAGTVCLVPVGTECRAGSDCVTGLCGTPRDGGTGPVCVEPCAAETDPAFCSRLRTACGTAAGTDNCGNDRTVSCGTCASGTTCQNGSCVLCGGASQPCCSDGTCTSPNTCGGAGTAGVCGCTPEANADFCSRLGKSCGSVAGTDNCGSPRAVSCGTCATGTSCQNGSCGSCGGAGQSCCDGSCTSPNSCGGGGTAGVCGCTKEMDAVFCSRLGKTCGSVSGADNCQAWRTVSSCGTCGTGTTCQNNSCVGCGGANQPCCGSTCASPNTCGGGGTIGVCGCTRETDAVFCSRLGKTCGQWSGTDNCGNARTVSSCGGCAIGTTCSNNACVTCGGASQPCCGGTSCATPNTCGGSGIAGMCGCTRETDAAFCSRLGKACGQWSGTDNCGYARTVSPCGTCAAGTTCQNYSCVACGGPSQTCCDGTTCNSGYKCSSGTCIACGGLDQPCCVTGTQCSRGTCTSGYCKVNLPACQWSQWFSEENGGTMSCSNGWAVRGVKCSGNYCDNMSLYCCPYTDLWDGATPSDTNTWFSEEQPRTDCPYPTQVVAGLHCSGNNCDNLMLRCLSTPKLTRSGTCYYAQAISDEDPAGYTCNAGYWVTGMQCTGDNCDNVSATCCPAYPTFQ